MQAALISWETAENLRIQRNHDVLQRLRTNEHPQTREVSPGDTHFVHASTQNVVPLLVPLQGKDGPFVLPQGAGQVTCSARG